MSKVIGIDVSKGSFDAAFLAEDGSMAAMMFKNTPRGFAKFQSLLQGNEHVVMEATGIYHLCLATYLHEKGIKVSVVNPLVIRRFSQMRLSRAKTDAKDAALIAQYGKLAAPRIWKPRKPVIEQLRQATTALESLIKQQTAFKCQLEARKSLPQPDKIVDAALQQTLNSIQESIATLEKHMLDLVEQHCQQSYQALKTIPGIGPKTAMVLIAITDGFERFDNVKQLVSYVGLTPRIYVSGTSVKGKARIAKMGMATIRKLLYVCAWSAKKYNAACKSLYERLKAKGKPERLIKIAIAHKLLRIAFAVATKNQSFEKNYYLKFG